MSALLRNTQLKFNMLRISIGLIYTLFGLLKFFPNLSPAETIGAVTVQKITLGLFTADMAIYSLAIMEVSLGLCLMFGKLLKPTILLAFFHMLMTFSPIFLFPGEAFRGSIVAPTLLTQYILKNIIIIFALFVIYPLNNSISFSKMVH